MNAAILAAALSLSSAPLAERLGTLVTLSASASAEERALYDEAVRLTLGTQTGRSLAEQYLALASKAEVRFEDVSGIGGRAEPGAQGDRVVLARSLLGWKPGWAGILAARTLAHELFGHILGYQRARAAGVAWELGASIDDEVNAAVIGYLVELEAGWRFLDPHAELLLSDREAYEADLLIQQPSYAATLRTGELSAPAAALRARAAELSDRPYLLAYFAERLAYLEADPAHAAALAAYKDHPFRRALLAELDARIERLRALAPPPPALQSPGG